MAKEIIRVPDIGSSDPVDVIELLVKVGDSLTKDDSLVVLESAKASVEVPSPVTGKVLALKVKVGERVKVGDELMEVDVAEGASAAPVIASAAKQPSTAAVIESEAKQPNTNPVIASSAKQSGIAAATTNAANSAPVHAGPAVRKLARQLGVDLAEVQAAGGQQQRILKEDLYAHVAKHLQQPSAAGFSPLFALLPEIDFAQFGEVERVPTSNLKRTAARRLQQNWQQLPQVTQQELADITELEAFRQQENKRHPQTKLSLLAFVAKAVTAALRALPQFNASLSGDGAELILKKYIHLGFAVDSERGLLVPVLKDADKLGVRDIAQGVVGLAERARSRKLLPADMQGASFTISSLGGIGGTAFSPLVNHPEVAILGLSRADWQPVWQPDKSEFVPRLMLPLSLSYDHRVIDGADAARFVVYLREQLADLRRLLL